ncbi:potassium channel protein [Sulfurovum sp.]|uniref:potassium channel protein n=1 Tax=Sulfurovum sp. TaxID=1969726 RepID=UPI0025D6B9F2|nr:potassium channel protein [Sulfurovum sp.]
MPKSIDSKSNNVIVTTIVKFAYLVKASVRYQKLKGFFYDLLENDQYRYKRWFDIFMIFIILSSVLILVIDVKKTLPDWLEDYDIYFVTSIFITEYLLRMWVYSDVHKMVIRLSEESQYLHQHLSLYRLLGVIIRDKWQYVISPAALVDLIAILPSYRQIRVLRILVLFRAFKMLRYARSLSSFLFILKSKKFELVTLLTLTAFFVFIAGIMLYVFEGDGDNKNITNLFDAFYWALVTISTVGYGDISPVTPEGRVVSMLIIITGVGLIAFMTSIIVSSFSERLVELREDRVMQEVGKKRHVIVICGFGVMGKKVAQGLLDEGSELIIVERDEEIAQQAHNSGYRSICADATKSAVFERIGIAERISQVLCLTSEDEQNAFIAINVKSLNPDVKVTARCSDKEIAEKLHYAGIDDVVIPEEITAMMGVVHAGEPVAFEALRSIVAHKGETHIDEVRVKTGGALENRHVEDLKSKAFRLIILGIVRPDEKGRKMFLFNPDDGTSLHSGDDLVFMGHPTAIAHFKQKVQP